MHTISKDLQKGTREIKKCLFTIADVHNLFGPRAAVYYFYDASIKYVTIQGGGVRGGVTRGSRACDITL